MPQSAIAKPRALAGVRRATGGKTLTEKAYRELEERIVTLQLKPGEFISEYALSHDLKIGRDSYPRGVAAIEPRRPCYYFAAQRHSRLGN